MNGLNSNPSSTQMTCAYMGRTMPSGSMNAPNLRKRGQLLELIGWHVRCVRMLLCVDADTPWYYGAQMRQVCLWEGFRLQLF